jgi:hypothetical protein
MDSFAVRDSRVEKTTITRSEAETLLADKQKFLLKQRKVEEELKARMSARGTLNLPKLLDQRRWEYGIPDDVFGVQPLFDRIFVWQVPEDEGDTFAGTSIIKPDTVKSREEGETPRGILVGAGLHALDSLRSNGIDLGHMVHFVRLSPWRRELKPVEGLSMNFVILRAGDLVDSEDLAAAMRAGKCTVVSEANKDGFMMHSLKGEDGKVWAPSEPWKSEDY